MWKLHKMCEMTLKINSLHMIKWSKCSDDDDPIRIGVNIGSVGVDMSIFAY